MLVPLLMPYRVGLGTEENTSRPGAAMSILPKLEKADGLSVGSSDATDMIVGEFAGAPVLDAALPAAATIRQPLFRAAWPAAVYAGCTGDCEPSDIEITTQRLAIAQFMPASTLPVAPPPELDSTLPTKIGALKAMPYRGVLPAGDLGPTGLATNSRHHGWGSAQP